MAERVLLREGGVQITPSRIVLGGTTYPMRGITSVRAITKTPSYARIAIPVLIGLSIGLLFFGSGQPLQGVITIVITAVLAYLSPRPQAEHSIFLATAGNEKMAYSSTDEDHIARIIDAINDALTMGG